VHCSVVAGGEAFDDRALLFGQHGDQGCRQPVHAALRRGAHRMLTWQTPSTGFERPVPALPCATLSGRMTTGSQPAPAHILRSPDHLLAAMPFLIGFHPHDSLVLVWLRRGSVALTQRVDLPAVPPVSLPADAASRWIAEVLSPLRHTDADGLVCVVYAPTSAGVAPDDFRPLLGELAGQAGAAGLDVLDLLMVRDDEWSRCATGPDDPPCQTCVLDPQIAAEVREDFVSAGWSHASTRDDLASDLMPDTRAQAVVRAAMRLLAPVRDEREAWRDATLEALMRDLDDVQAHTAEQLARVILGLADIRVRDCLLWHLVHRDDLAGALRLATAAMVAAPERHRAPVATVAGITAWLLGDGVRASLCIEAALADDGDYGLAVLVAGALANGLPPRMWRETLDQLSFETCRYGADT
jgi:hypothetical protein